jgi:hypothetical protein
MSNQSYRIDVNGRIGVSVVLILMVLGSPFLMLSDVNTLSTNDPTIEETKSCCSSDVAYSSPVNISSDSELAEYGWPGNGTESSPYLIAGLQFSYPDQEPIIIENTRAHFVIRDCVFEKQGMPAVLGNVNAIHIFNVSNGIVEDCSISATSVAIGVTNSSNMIIRNNRVRDTEFGFLFDSLKRSIIHNNSIISGYDGIVGNELIFCNITENTIAEVDWGLCLGEWCVNNIISHNRVGWCFEEYAYDYGSNNNWNGNSWSNWNGLGPYIISGTAGSTDESPSLFDEDVLGPTIQFDRPPGILDSTGVFTFSIIVSDVSGVDSVIIFIRETWYVEYEVVRSNWSEFTMQHQPNGGNPNNYTLSFQTNDSWGASFIVLANDTLGHSRMSEMDSFVVNPHPPSIPDVPPPPPSYQLALALGVLVIIILSIAVNNRSKNIHSTGILNAIRIR